VQLPTSIRDACADPPLGDAGLAESRWAASALTTLRWSPTMVRGAVGAVGPDLYVFSRRPGAIIARICRTWFAPPALGRRADHRGRQLRGATSRQPFHQTGETS